MNRVLFCPPTYFALIDVKNPFMRDAAPLDHVQACLEWERVRRAFHDAGMTLHAIDAVAGLEDMVFANNQVFVGSSPSGERFIVPSRMRFQSRQREVPYFVEWFRARGYQVTDLALAGGEYLEGHGDLLWQVYAGGSTSAAPDQRFSQRPLVWAGHGFRSSATAVEKLAAAMAPRGIDVVPLELTDERFYHLDTCLAPLAADSVLIYPRAFAPAALAALRQRCPRVYAIEEQDALAFVCNGVAVNGRFITPYLSPVVAEALKKEELEPVLVPTEEFAKSGGSVCCLKLFLL